MKKSGIFLLVLLFALSAFVSADVSNSETQIRILGCAADGSHVGIDSCIQERITWGWCKQQNLILWSANDKDACSKGMVPADVDFASGIKPYNVCCPGGEFRCVSMRDDKKTPAGYGGTAHAEAAFYCVPATTDCTDHSTEANCISEDNIGQCYWYNGNCTARVDGCYGYQTQTECEVDNQSVATGDPNCRFGETESSGIPYVIAQDSCACFWEVPATGQPYCGLRYNITPSFGDGTDYAQCEYSLIKGTCVDGFETYTYNATMQDGTYTTNPLLPGDARCVDRTGRRKCGQSIVQVPFFSPLNFVLLVFLLSIFYIVKIKFFGEKK